MATLYDVCKKTGLSTATVSRVINGSGLVKEATRERVLKAMKELNYYPSHAARMLAGSKTDTIGVILPVIDNGYYVRVLRGIDVVSTRANLKLLISFYHSGSDLSDILSSLSGEGRADALILSNDTPLQPEQIRKLAGSDIPIALIGQKHEDQPAMDSVLLENFQGAGDAVKHLLEKGPKSLIVITGPEDNHDSQERLRGVRQAVADAACDVELVVLHGDFYHEGGRAVFEEYVKQSGAFPEAVFAFNDAMALGVLDVLNEASVSIPGDVQVIGFDNNEIAQYIGLTTVRVPMQKIGEEAARLVAERIKNKELPAESVLMETALVARKTTGNGASFSSPKM
ncbi:MAG: LacI family DNA-binding transcriptional regulator [Pontiellaceae bacterium]|nr:LacI family DNA-binding transcriptional regulator [Pontiellaceae bacterium]MBN2785997.1 LacI family DNA-binding transcriptional regulator [Pontiellaceae bacterium]